MKKKFIYYKGFSIEKISLTIKDQKKKLNIFIVHELNHTFESLEEAKASINFLAR
jgi:hypothetical protein